MKKNQKVKTFNLVDVDGLVPKIKANLERFETMSHFIREAIQKEVDYRQGKRTGLVEGENEKK